MTTHDLLISNMKERLCQAFDVHHLEIIDDSHKHADHTEANGGGHFRLILISHNFKDMSRINRQRAVLNVFQDMIPYPIHALSMKLMDGDEWAS